ncbi:MAG: hypothetical protein Q7U24_12775, partial [Sulfurimicrobium sp.]|nr:hypothetical protein [Sulfurimicrobium sp.]
MRFWEKIPIGLGGKSGSGNKDDGSHGGLFPPGTMNPSKSKQCDDDDGDDCKQKATDWELEQAGINAH